MSFLKDLVNDFVGGGDNNSQPSGPPPQVPRPWRAEWDGREEKWVFINEETGDRTHRNPSDNDGFSEGAANWAGRTVGEAEEFGDDTRRNYDNAVDRVEDIPSDMRQGYDNFENRVEGGFDRFANRIEDIPQDISYGAGKAYGEVQDFGQDVADVPGDIAQGFDRFGNRVEQGYDRMEGNVERYGDEQENAFNAGRQEGRRDDGW
ncbi:hypothetical protein C1H76_6242 [Elsinoe australis]|uniref:WW domain-containing protein n=1 Tax=Elsinoe australis TaxID=40998 RepID=A0A4U7AZ18_9PEZI|nr:hypothetical protein C1H76_6242 [Elsinoe australis]